MGKKAKELWIEIPNKFENVKLDAFVVMPNHIHGIVIIGKYWEYARRIVRDSDAINRFPTGRKRDKDGIGQIKSAKVQFGRRLTFSFTVWYIYFLGYGKKSKGEVDVL